MPRDGALVVLNGADAGTWFYFQYEAQGVGGDNSAHLTSIDMPNTDDPLCFWMAGEQKKFRARLEFFRGTGANPDTAPDLEDVLRKFNRWKSRDPVLRTAPTVMFSHGFHIMMVGLIKQASPSGMELDADNRMGRLSIDFEMWKTPVPPGSGGIADPLF